MNKFDKIFDTPITNEDLIEENRSKLDTGIYTGFGTKCTTGTLNCYDCCDLCVGELGCADKCIFCGHEIPSNASFTGGRGPHECAGCGVILLSCFYMHTDNGSLFTFTGYLNKIDGIKDDII